MEGDAAPDPDLPAVITSDLSTRDGDSDDDDDDAAETETPTAKEVGDLLRDCCRVCGSVGLERVFTGDALGPKCDATSPVALTIEAGAL